MVSGRLRFAVSHPKRKDKDALRVGHPAGCGEFASQEQMQVQPRVLRLRCASLRQASLWGGFVVSHPKRRDKDALRWGTRRVVVSLHRKEQMQLQPQILRLRCAS